MKALELNIINDIVAAHDQIKRHHYDEYALETLRALQEMQKSFRKLDAKLEREIGPSRTESQKKEYIKTSKKITGRAGSRIGAEKKRLQRIAIIALFRNYKLSGLDVTPSTVKLACKLVIGRSCHDKVIAKEFSDGSRNASNKSLIYTDDSQKAQFTEATDKLRHINNEIISHTQAIRKAIKRQLKL